MKIRILNDIKENRQLYKHVPMLHQVTKYRARTDVAVAVQTKKREEAKARKARHVSHRKCKRLLPFYYYYYVLDQEDKSSRPKGGVRLPKDLDLPPKGVSTWMISQRWLRAIRRRHTGELDTIEELVDDSVQSEWGRFHVLGEETEGSDTDAPVNHAESQPGFQFPPLPFRCLLSQFTPQHRSTASSLDYALVH
ncbi:hypothetical protein MD484_g8238, partial [Candolleomyces efflorescens]